MNNSEVLSERKWKVPAYLALFFETKNTLCLVYLKRVENFRPAIFREAWQYVCAAQTTVHEVQLINLSQGLQLRCLYFQNRLQEANFLVLMVNPIVADGISMQLLLENFRSPVKQLHVGERVVLPPKTSSVQLWGERLAQSCRAQQFQAELQELVAYKSSWPSPALEGLPWNYPDRNLRERSADTLTLALDPMVAHILLRQAWKRWHIIALGLLQTILAYAVAKWTGADTIPLCVVVHERDSFDPQINLARTVGFFPGLVGSHLHPEKISACAFSSPHLRFAQEILCFSREVEERFEAESQYTCIYDRYAPNIVLNYTRTIQVLAERETVPLLEQIDATRLGIRKATGGIELIALYGQAQIT